MEKYKENNEKNLININNENKDKINDINNNENKEGNLLIQKKRRRRRKKKIVANKIVQVIQYGHPKSIIYKTMKQKLNSHKKFDIECRNDSLLLIHTVSQLKTIIKKLITHRKIKNKNRLQILKDFYRSSILSIQHREYAQDITGYNLI